MSEINKIKSFKSFSDLVAQEKSAKIAEENVAKRSELASKISTLLDEMNITSFEDLDEEVKKEFITKAFGQISEDEAGLPAEELEDETKDVTEPVVDADGSEVKGDVENVEKDLELEGPGDAKSEKIAEGNAFLGARAKAIEEDRDEFEFNGKSYKVTTKSNVSEGNAFGDAVRKAKEAGDKEFEFEGETYKVEEAYKINEEIFDSEMTADYNSVLTTAKKYGIPIAVAMATVASMGVAASIVLIKKGAKAVKSWLEQSENESVFTEAEATDEVIEGNAFSTARLKAIEAGEKEFEFDGKTYPLTKVDAEDKEVAKDMVEEGAIFNEGKDDYVARYIDTNINLKKGYKHLNDEELKQIYLEIGELIADNKLKVKDATLTFESVVTEAVKEVVLSNEILDFLEERGILKASDAQKVHKDLTAFLKEKGFVAESVKSINEDQFSWMAQDTGNQIGSEKQNTITITMFDDKGNKWEEKKYDGYGEFGGKDYYELLAQMNGIENADRQDGIDIAFDKKKVKGKVLFPALVEDPKRFNFKKHDFTQEAEHDPNQSWYQEEEYDESVITEAKGNALQDYVEAASQKTFKGGGNGQNLLDDAMGLAGHIDSYTLGRDTRGYEEDGFYGPLTITAFKKLVDQMSADDIKNNQADKFESLDVNEAEIKSDDEFKEYAMTVLKKAFGADFDEAKAGEVANGILKKCDGDYGACVGMLTSSLGESITNEAIDIKYWSDYNTDTSGQSKHYSDKSTDFEDTFEDAVAEWNQEADGAENRIKGAQIQKIKKMAQEFFKKAGWISVNVVQAMIMQES